MKGPKYKFKHYKINRLKYAAYMFMTCMLFPIVFFSGCGKLNDNKIIITTGFADDQVFKIGDQECKLSEMMVYITDLCGSYEKTYGDGIWEKDINGVSLENSVKEIALARLSQVKAVSAMAEDRGIVLDEEETDRVEKATEIYFESLDENAVEQLQIDKDTIYELYREYALSQKVYDSIIKDVNPEISDDEARTITVKYIFIKTYNYDDDGSRRSYDNEHKQAARKLTDSLRQRIVEGEDIETLALQYSDSQEVTMSVGKGEMDTAFEVAAFKLSNNELSDVIETEYGYYIVECISTFDREVTDENKLKIIEKRKQEAFCGEYEAYILPLTKRLNEELWESITLDTDKSICEKNFVGVFEELKE